MEGVGVLAAPLFNRGTKHGRRRTGLPRASGQHDAGVHVTVRGPQIAPSATSFRQAKTPTNPSCCTPTSAGCASSQSNLIQARKSQMRPANILLTTVSSYCSSWSACSLRVSSLSAPSSASGAATGQRITVSVVTFSS
eukprot:CAMPEP_0204468780 /NCGR_PEP_ID=MMETSP0471-20130131/10760_1 /ASSEMBLY_ACC=CAM_ASM_000602 /TAXON_ID=2969 /ORGANISM="Oxyrrhis marina" /LENGTH=137 /DNA_ID=CAMNT_0051470615 /DNA_START=63 /DNA_END=476 /DNA_ORIENTATION=+